MNRREFMMRTGAAVLSSGLWMGSAAAQRPKRPNIIFIMADDLGYGHLGCYGQRIIQTPHLDRLAAEGMRFTQAYAGSSLCAPSRSVLMTGYHAGHTPVRGNSGGIPLRSADFTMAEALRAAGYSTGLFGKWGLGDAGTSGAPNSQGFDEFFGVLHQKHAHFYYTDYLWQNTERYPLEGNRDGKRTQYTHDVILGKALDFIRSQGERPFFCFLSMTIPHHEWTVPEESLAQYAGKFEEHPPEFKWREGYAFPKEPKANMAAMISHMDRGIGQVMETLRELGISEDTLVLFTSDNGADRYSIASPEFFEANGALRGYKGELYEGGIRVPAMAWWPGRIEAGSTSDHPWYFADLMPTFAELAGSSIPLPGDIDGISLVPSLLGETAGRPQETHEYLYWEQWSADLPRAVRMGDWKAVWPKKDGYIELYNLREDVGEQHNVAAEQPALALKLADVMNRSHVDPPPQIEPDAPDGRYYR